MNPPRTKPLARSNGFWLMLCVASLFCHIIFSDGVRAFLREAWRLSGKL